MPTITIDITDQEVIDCFCALKGYVATNPLTNVTRTKEEFIKDAFVQQLKDCYTYEKKKEVVIADVSNKIS
jgi:hypothetical protein